jgi:hypothetical protein
MLKWNSIDDAPNVDYVLKLGVHAIDLVQLDEDDIYRRNCIYSK